MGIDLLRLRELERRTGRRSSSCYEDIGRGLMTPPIHWGRSAMWPSNEVDAIIDARIAGKSEDEIKALVKHLVAARRQPDAAAA